MTSSSPPALVIFDVCDTLYDANTTVGFVEHYQQVHRHSRIRRSLRRWTSRVSPFFYAGALTHRLLGWDLPRERLVAALAGEPQSQLENAARDYAQQVLPSLAIQSLHDRLVAHRAVGDRVLLMSSSLDLVVAPIAAALGVEYEASTVGFAGGICTGRIDRDLTGRKSAIARQLIKGENTFLRIYTDNRSDHDLVRLADRATIVIPRGRRDVRWGGPDCEYIRL